MSSQSLRRETLSINSALSASLPDGRQVCGKFEINLNLDMKKLLIVLLFPFQLYAQSFSKTEVSQWELQAKQVTIIRDNWGIPHIYGKTDADAVFGLMYAQCEDDFKRVEMNYMEKLGRMAEVKGES